MNLFYIVFLIIFILIIGICAFINTRQGFFKALNSLLRIALPMLLSGIIVKIAQLISNKEMSISYIIGFIGTIIFYLVIRSMIKNTDTGKNGGIVDYFLGFVIGVIQGWLIAGFLVVYLNFNYFGHFQILNIEKMISPGLFEAIKTPIDWILFLSFIKL